MGRFRSLPRRSRWGLVAGLLAVAAIAAGLVTFLLAGFADRDAVHLFAAEGRARPLTALYFSGDMGLRFGMGPYTAAGLAQQGIPVMGVSSSTLFAQHQTAARTDAIVAEAVRQALARSGSDRLILIGQSFGADILQTGLAHLPAALRPRIASVILVVPGETVFFRADPLGFAYRGTPDSLAAHTLPAIDWVPLTCIYGVAEPDSACPSVRGANTHVVAMPGGHFLKNDHDALLGQVMAAIRRDVPTAFRTTGE